MRKNIHELLVTPTITVREALLRLETTSQGFC